MRTIEMYNSMKKIKYAEGYFTVEAAMVMVFALGCIIFLIRMIFYQYDRCLLEQDLGTLAFRGVVLQEMDNEQRLQEIQDMAASLYLDKYILLEQDPIFIKIKQGYAEVVGGGRQSFPVTGLLPGISDIQWTVQTNYTNRRTDPALFIRTIRRLKTNKKEEDIYAAD